MKTFYVLWTYMANYSRLIPVRARTPEEAAAGFRDMYSDDFSIKGTVYVFDHPPALIVHKGQEFRRDDTDPQSHIDDYRRIS